MQEYLEEMARRQATGWTPGVPTRYTGALPTSYPAFSNLSALWAGSQPKANLGDIAAASADPKPAPRRGRPRTTPEKLQSISDRAGTGTLKSIAPMLGAISKVAGPAAIAYDALRSDPAVASTEVPPGGYFYESQAYPSMAVEEGYPNVSTLPSFDVTPDAGGAIGGIPGVQPMEKYGPSGYEGESIPPSGYRQIAPDSVIAASDFEVGPTSMAQVGGKPVISLPDVPVSQPSAPVGSPSWGFIEPFAEMTGVDPTHFDRVDIIDKLASSGALNTPSTHTDDTYAAALKSSDLASSGVHPALVGALGLQGLFTANVPSTVGHFAGLVDSPHAGQAIDDSIEQNILGITTPDVTPNMWDTSAISSVAPALPSFGVATGLTKQEMLDAGWKESTTGGLFPWGPTEKQMQNPDRVADMEEDTQIDTFSTGFPTGPVSTGSGGGFRPGFASQRDTYAPEDIPAAPAQPAGPTPAEIAAAQAEKDRQAQIAAAAASAITSKRAIAKAKAAANKEKKAAARRAAAAQRALDSARAAAARAVAASAAQAKTAQANARAVLAAAAGRDRGGPSAREIAAAIEVMSQVDSFGSGGQRGFMGAEIGIEDGGGYTGGDFSSGAGWE